MKNYLRTSLPFCMAMALLLLGFSGMAQSDRPCNSPIIPADECTYYNATFLRNTSFQPDAPLSACAGNYTRDGWFRFIAPAADITISRSVMCTSPLASCTVPGDPGSINMALYQAGPDCNNLTLVEDCPAGCFLGIACVTAGVPFSEGIGEGDHFLGLTPGSVYYLRVMWDSVSVGPPDTVVINVRSGAPCNLCLPCGLSPVPHPLAASGMHLEGELQDDKVHLNWEMDKEELAGAEMSLFRQTAGSMQGWYSIASEWEVTDHGDGRFAFVDEHWRTAGDQVMYKVGLVHTDGSTSFSNPILLRGERSLEWSVAYGSDGVRLNLNTTEPVRMKILDMKGSVLMQTEWTPGQGDWFIPNGTLSTGVYICKGISNGDQAVRRFVVSE